MRDLTPADAPRKPAGEETVIVIDQIPAIPEAKVTKLKTVITKVMKAYGEVIQIHMPMDPNAAKTLGFCFVEFRTREQAHEAVMIGNGYRLDKKHVFKITAMSEFDKTMNTPDEWVAPTDAEFEEKENLHSWLQNPYCEDQFVVRHGARCEVNWLRKMDVSTVEGRDKWSDATPAAPVAWSPRGTYMATFHRQGIALWGGRQWTRIARFAHSSVTMIEISPQERYMVTWSKDAPYNEKEPQTYIVWDIKSGQKLRGFNADKDGGPMWPLFRWSHDDQYFAKMKQGDAISVYQTPSCELLDKKSLKIKDLRDFSWSPSDNKLVYWTPEMGERPARVTICAIPSRQELTTKNLYQVKDCKLIWQKSGDHLCVYVERWTKSKKQTYTQFMLFHMQEKLIACDLLEIKDKIEHFAWEPIGTKFAIIHGEGPGRMNCSVYDITDQKLAPIKVYERIEGNTLFWSPRGRHCIIAGMGNVQASGAFQFVDTSDPDSKEMGGGSHINATECEWDPSGRFAITCVSAWSGVQHDTGYMIWSFQGKPLQRIAHQNCFQAMWRPRPPTLLSKAQIDDVSKNFKMYAPQFEAEDKLKTERASEAVLQQRRKLMDEWDDILDQAIYYKSKREALLAALRPPLVEDDGEVQEIDEVHEVFVREDVEIIG